MPCRLNVIVSGCHSGPNPSPGVGAAASLRAAFPDLRLIGRDFSPAATGLHASVFDEAWVCPPWEDADLDLQWRQLREQLTTDTWMIPTLDHEVAWLAGFDHPRILAPRTSTLELVGKPAVHAAAGLPARIPPAIPLSAGEREVEGFCRRFSWKVWVKGPTHESRVARSWRNLVDARAELAATWGEDGLFVQAHVDGEEVSLAFAAFEGELLDDVLLEKRAVTAEGKVWGGLVTDIPDALGGPLRELLRELDWTGGGELEFIRDSQGDLWLFDWNPRFPAWIYGATLAGHNLPAALLARAAGLERPNTPRAASGFVRVVVEVPARMPLPAAAKSLSLGQASGKHPSGMPQLSRRLHRVGRGPVSRPRFESDLTEDLLDITREVRSTPTRVLLPRTAAVRFEIPRRLGSACPRLRVAYSVKTNPAPEVMTLAREQGLWAETISHEEVDWSVGCRCPADQIIYNGPVPWQPTASVGKLGVVFADDAEAFSRYLLATPAEIVGVRVRPPFTKSRFGVQLDEPDELSSLISCLGRAAPDQRLGISFHYAASEIGLARWEQMALGVIDFAAAIEVLSGRVLGVIDLGGGWSPGQFSGELEAALSRLVATVREKLKGDPILVIEPGKALIEPSLALLTRVLHIRHGRHGRMAVLDAGVADVPLAEAFPHRLAVVREDVLPLGAGQDRLLGPSCMENDRLADGVCLPEDLAVGDLIAVCDVGAYDASMAHALGRGWRE